MPEYVWWAIAGFVVFAAVLAPTLWGWIKRGNDLDQKKLRLDFVKWVIGGSVVIIGFLLIRPLEQDRLDREQVQKKRKADKEQEAKDLDALTEVVATRDPKARRSNLRLMAKHGPERLREEAQVLLEEEERLDARERERQEAAMRSLQGSLKEQAERENAEFRIAKAASERIEERIDRLQGEQREKERVIADAGTNTEVISQAQAAIGGLEEEVAQLREELAKSDLRAKTSKEKLKEYGLVRPQFEGTGWAYFGYDKKGRGEEWPYRNFVILGDGNREITNRYPQRGEIVRVVGGADAMVNVRDQYPRSKVLGLRYDFGSIVGTLHSGERVEVTGRKLDIGNNKVWIQLKSPASSTE